MELINLNKLPVTRTLIDVKRGYLTIKFDNGEALVCRLVKSLNNGKYRKAVNLNALGLFQKKVLSKNNWLQTPGHHDYIDLGAITSVVYREARLKGLPIL